MLLRALPQIVAVHPDLEVLVAGPGDQEEVTEGLPEGVREHIRFLGLVSDADKVSAFASADIYVAPNTGRGELRDRPSGGDGGRHARGRQ